MQFATIIALAATLLTAVSAKRVDFVEDDFPFAHMEAEVAAGAAPPAPATTLYDPPSNFSILEQGAPVMVDTPISVYYIFYGNFTDLEISRIENYAKHVSDPSTKPNRWSIATQYYNDAGQRVNKVLKHGGSVRDWYSQGMNISTTIGFQYDHINNITDPSVSDMSKIIVSHIGDKEGQFPYDPQGIYALVTAPEVTNWDNQPPLHPIQYGGYHFSYNTTLPSGKEVLLNHAYAQTIGRFKTGAHISQSPQGDTGRRVVDYVVDVLHHEIFEALSDPVPNTAWNDISTPDLGIGENGDACEYATSFASNIRYTESTLNSTGVWYNTIINGQKYTLQDIWVADKDNVQGCYAEVVDTRGNEFKAVSAARNPVTAALGINNYTGPVHIPCRAYYTDRYHGGYTTPGENVCHSWFNGVSFTRRLPVDAPLDVPVNFHVLSQNHAHYQWLKVDETNAIKVFDDDVNPPTTGNNRVFAIFQDNWKQGFYPDHTWYVQDAGAFYFCRAFVKGVWRVGETNKFSETCDIVVDGALVNVPKTDDSVAFLVKPSPYKA
ncbi:hypothetical protein HDU76_005138 [Blyttiomyces sp. JEL0837]|nr:hypothetical protein HDU76_005138 [Blyttiomyces sp. JEL0837]